MIEHKDQLLQQIAEQLYNVSSRATLGSIVVAFVHDDNEYVFGLPQALSCLANDTHWDERGNWSECKVAEVRVI